MNPRSELYQRLPLLDADRWWLELAAASPDGRVIEVGAGTGRLSAAFADAGSEVIALEHDTEMLDHLRRRLGGRGEVVAADASQLPDGPAVGLVALPASLLNELPGPAARRAVLARAAGRCRPDGVVAMELLSPWWLVRLPQRSTGRLQPADGSPVIHVTIEAGPFEAWSGRRRAELTYRFPDGHVLRDELDAAVVTPDELLAVFGDAGLERLTGSGDGPGLDRAPWQVLARPTVGRAG